MKQSDIIRGNSAIAKMLSLTECEKPYSGAVTTNARTFEILFFNSKMIGESWFVYPEFHCNYDWIHIAIKFIQHQGYRIYIQHTEDGTVFTITDMKIVSQSHSFGGGDVISKSHRADPLEAIFIGIVDFAVKFNSNIL